MKGIAVDCLRDLVRTGSGDDTWRKIAIQSGIDADRPFEHNEDVADEQVLTLFAKTCEIGDLTFEQACDAFGAHWAGVYIPRAYPEFYEGIGSARELLLKLDSIHSTMRQRLSNANPPRHSYDWKDERTLIMGYHSQRDLIALFIGAVNGIARHFGDAVTVSQLDDQRVEIAFH